MAVCWIIAYGIGLERLGGILSVLVVILGVGFMGSLGDGQYGRFLGRWAITAIPLLVVLAVFSPGLGG